jgi:acyl-coenzyme A synthetase/AMP-(fatty) acid ligase
LPAYRVEVLGDDGKMVSPGTTGHLVMRGPGMFDAYLFPFRLRREVLSEGWFHTGDLAVKDEHGLISLMGRKKSMINVAGNKVFPEEVESVLNRHPAVSVSRVSGFQHPLLGECVAAEVVLKPGTDATGSEALRNYCLEHLSSYKVPQRIEIVQDLPMTGSGKIKRD